MTTTRKRAAPTTRGELYLTRDEAADHLRVSVRTVSRLYRSGQIVAVRVGQQVRIPQSSLDAYVAARTGEL